MSLPREFGPSFGESGDMIRYHSGMFEDDKPSFHSRLEVVSAGLRSNRSLVARQVFFWFALTLVGSWPLHADDPKVAKGPLSTDDALKSFVLASPELKLELVAGEPEVIDPVAIAFDADGSLWVVEMRDYPYGPRPGSQEKPKSHQAIVRPQPRWTFRNRDRIRR